MTENIEGKTENPITLKDAQNILYDYLSYKNPPKDKVAAVVIVGGNNYREGIHDQSLAAANLLTKELANNVIISCSPGGNPGNLTKPEHETYRDELLELGIPTEKIHARQGGNNTLAEARSAIEDLQRLEKEQKINISDGVVITPYTLHARRANLSWEHALNEKGINIPLYCAPKAPEKSFDLNDIEVSKRMYEEILRIIVYRQQGNLSDSDIQPHNKDEGRKIYQATKVMADYIKKTDPEYFDSIRKTYHNLTPKMLARKKAEKEAALKPQP